MSSKPQFNSPETRQLADARLRRLTRTAALVATGAAIAIGVVVAKEHPGASAPSKQVPLRPPASTPTSSAPRARSGSTSPTTTTTSPPTKTRSRPVVTSGGTSR
jgi:hypothetical protein